MSGLDIESVLAAHSYLHVRRCKCGAQIADFRAHVAAVLREQIVAAQAEAWDEGYRLDWTGGVKWHNPYRPAPQGCDCPTCRPGCPGLRGGGMSMEHSAEKDAQRIEYERHIAESEARGECPFSGLTFARCQASICDCFREQYPDDPYGLHPEAFTVLPPADPAPARVPSEETP